MSRAEVLTVTVAAVIGIGGFIAVVRAAWRELRQVQLAEPGCVNVSDETVASSPGGPAHSQLVDEDGAAAEAGRRVE
jgi:hypothetical protein